MACRRAVFFRHREEGQTATRHALLTAEQRARHAQLTAEVQNCARSEPLGWETAPYLLKTLRQKFRGA